MMSPMKSARALRGKAEAEAESDRDRSKTARVLIKTRFMIKDLLILGFIPGFVLPSTLDRSCAPFGAAGLSPGPPGQPSMYESKYPEMWTTGVPRSPLPETRSHRDPKRSV